MFFGSLPDAQYGDTSVVDISYGITGAPVKTAQNLKSPTNSSTMIGTSDGFSSQLIEAGTNLTLDVLALRRGEAGDGLKKSMKLFNVSVRFHFVLL